MGTEDLLVGNIAIAAILIKTIISSVKQAIPMSRTVIYIVTVLLGVASAFALNVELVSIVGASAIAIIAQKLFAGLFIASSAMGVHETTKVIKKNAN